MLPLLATYHEAARSVLPPEVYEYYASGSGDEVTLSEAGAAWAAHRLRPRALQDVSATDTAVDLLGARLATPVGVAPMALQHLAHPEAELATAKGAAAAGALLVLSTRASCRIEDVGAAAGAWWFQTYVLRNRAVTAALVERAAAAGAAALVLTGDTPYVARKRKVSGVRIDVPQERLLVNLGDHLEPGTPFDAAMEQDPSITVAAIRWLGEVSGLPVVVKGVLRGDTAKACLDAGAAGVIVSNHGGRQLDRAVPSALALGEVREAAGPDALVLADGGLTSGLDVLVALALGASAVLVGRPLLWALAHSGADGVAACLGELTSDLRHAMGLAGAADVAGLDRSLVAGP